jgi:hypothetical protein
MPKVKRPAKKKIAKPAARPATKVKKPAARPAVPSRASKTEYSEEYVEYLERHTLYGTGRPRLSPADFDRLDDEMLDLLGTQAEIGLSDEQVVRLQELEFLLLDSEQ